MAGKLAQFGIAAAAIAGLTYLAVGDFSEAPPAAPSAGTPQPMKN